MTEAEWLSGGDPERMMTHVRTRKLYGPRRRRHLLLNVALCRHIWHLLIDERSRAHVESVERRADGRKPGGEPATGFAASDACFDLSPKDQRACYAANVASSSDKDGRGSFYFLGYVIEPDERDRIAQSVLLDLYGNPFRPVTLDPALLTSTVTALARQMYETRDFSAMPILADALQDAGCENAEILDHCRGPGPHVRGCWVVDLVLGKE
jgi:hypothetical protein